MDDTLYIYRNEGRMVGELSELVTLNPLCTRAELWAAIKAIEAETENLWRCPFDEASAARARLLTARNRARALLGMEPES